MNTATITANTDPNPIRFTERAKRWAAGVLLASMGVAGAGAYSYAKAVWQDNKLAANLEQPKSDVAKEIKSGEINPADVVRVEAPATGYAANVAQEIVGNDHDYREVSDIMTAQTNNTAQVVEGQQFELPKNDVPADSPYIVVGPK